MANVFKIIVPRNFKGWERGAFLLGFDLANRTAPWELAAKEFYDATQEVVHVITGRLKRSGSYGVERTRRGPVAFVGYTAWYAQVEIDRGGDHDFMGRGWEIAQAKFSAAVGDTWQDVIRSWNR
jgi:hypothetical protein